MALKLVADFQHKYSVYFGQSVDWLVKKEDMSSKNKHLILFKESALLVSLLV